MQLQDIIIILSRPGEAGNVGAVCRAMKNTGLYRLRLAAPEFTVTDTQEAGFKGELSEAGFGYGGTQAIIKARAVHAGDIWEKAETVDSLAAAVKDCSLVIGTTRRRGRHRKQITMTPPELAAFLKSHPGPAALVFGNERTGLEDHELDLCNMASHIPADDAFPSINLSHAVMIYAYELFCNLRSAKDSTVKGQWIPMNQEKTKLLVKNLTDKLKVLGFYKKTGREEQERFLLDLFSRAGLTEREAQYFHDLLIRADRLSQKQDFY